MIEMKFFLEKYKKVVLLIISILTVLTVLLNTTYSLLFKNDETEVQSYATGILEIESETTDNSITLTNAFPMSDSEGASLTPFTFNIKNNGNVKFKCDLKLLSTSLTNQIDPDYIKVKVNNSEPVTLGSVVEGNVLPDQVIPANGVYTLNIRVWLADNTPNTEINKIFNAKVVVEGYAIYSDFFVPYEYQAVEYLQASGTQYIDTGLTIDFDDSYDYEIVANFSNSNYGGANGYLQFTGDLALNTKRKLLLSYNGITHMESVYIDDVLNSTNDWNYLDFQDVKIAIFKLGDYNNGWYSQSGQTGKIYYVKIYNNGIIVRDFVPVYRKVDNVGGMFDVINGEFYTNVGTGTFIVGEDVI